MPPLATTMDFFYTPGFGVDDASSSTYHVPTTISLLPAANAGVHRSFPMTPGQTIAIGRASRDLAKGLLAAPDNALFDCPVVSRRHAELICHTDHVAIVDTGSSHGTFVNGTQLVRDVSQPLSQGDEVRLGCEINSTHGNHDGVTFIVECIDRPSASSSGPQEETARRGFCMYGDEDSEHDSASDKDDASVVEEQHPVSSNHTTPDAKLTSGVHISQCIDVRPPVERPRNAINVVHAAGEGVHSKTLATVDSVEDEWSRYPKSCNVDSAPEDDHDVDDDDDEEDGDDDSVIEEHAVMSIMSDSESDFDEHEYDDDQSSIHEDPLSGLDASDIISEPESIDEGPELMSSRKQASLELGDPDKNFSQPPIKVLNSAPRLLRYDPVRGSQPPDPANASSSEIMPPYFSRWDIAPPALEQYQGDWSHPCMAPALSPMYLGMPPVSTFVDSAGFVSSLCSDCDQPDLSTSTKLSIPAVLDKPADCLQDQEQSGPIHADIDPVVESHAALPTNKKRKNEDISQDDPEDPVSVEATTTPSAPCATADSEALQHLLTIIKNDGLKEPPAKKAKTAAYTTQWSLKKEATRLICYAAVGGAACFAFLVSPAAETLHSVL